MRSGTDMDKLSDQTLEAFGKEVKKARKAKKITQAKLASECGLSQGAVSKVQSGISVVDIDKLKEIELYLELRGLLASIIERDSTCEVYICSRVDCNELLPYFSGGEVVWRPELHDKKGFCNYGHELMRFDENNNAKNKALDAGDDSSDWITIGPDGMISRGLYGGEKDLKNTIYLKLNTTDKTKPDKLREKAKLERERRESEHAAFKNVEL